MDRVSAWTSLCTLAGLFRQGTQTGGVPATPIIHVAADCLSLGAKAVA